MLSRIKQYVNAAAVVVDIIKWTLEERRKFKSYMPWYMYDIR